MHNDWFQTNQCTSNCSCHKSLTCTHCTRHSLTRIRPRSQDCGRNSNGAISQVDMYHSGNHQQLMFVHCLLQGSSWESTSLDENAADGAFSFVRTQARYRKRFSMSRKYSQLCRFLSFTTVVRVMGNSPYPVSDVRRPTHCHLSLGSQIRMDVVWDNHAMTKSSNETTLLQSAHYNSSSCSSVL